LKRLCRRTGARYSVQNDHMSAERYEPFFDTSGIQGEYAEGMVDPEAAPSTPIAFHTLASIR
jgi:hypothetical protein